MRHSDLFRAYLRDLFTMAQQGDAREESYYPARATMVAEMAKGTGRRQIYSDPIGSRLNKILGSYRVS